MLESITLLVLPVFSVMNTGAIMAYSSNFSIATNTIRARNVSGDEGMVLQTRATFGWDIWVYISPRCLDRFTEDLVEPTASHKMSYR